MKASLFICAMIVSAGLLSACASSGGGSAPALAGNTPNTGPTPAPDKYQRNSLINSSTMIAPTRP